MLTGPSLGGAGSRSAFQGKPDSPLRSPTHPTEPDNSFASATHPTLSAHRLGSALRKRKRQASDIALTSWHIPELGVSIRHHSDGSEAIKGRGCCGRVLKGHSPHLGYVAVKVVAMPDFERRLAIIQAYIQLQNCIRAPNIVEFYGVFQQGNNVLVVTNYMAGKDLRSALTQDKKKRLHWNSKGAGIALDVIKALRGLHANGGPNGKSWDAQVVHRHLKSSNVLFSATERVALADAGLADLLDADISDHGTLGSFAWAAPELLLGERCTEQVDLYSFGVLLWELVTQEMPLRGKLRPPLVPAECPAEVVTLIGDCLVHDPGRRPTAAQAYERLAELCVHGSSEAGREANASSDVPRTPPAQLPASIPRVSVVEPWSSASGPVVPKPLDNTLYDSNLQALPSVTVLLPSEPAGHDVRPPNPFEGAFGMGL